MLVDKPDRSRMQVGRDVRKIPSSFVDGISQVSLALVIVLKTSVPIKPRTVDHDITGISDGFRADAHHTQVGPEVCRTPGLFVDNMAEVNRGTSSRSPCPAPAGHVTLGNVRVSRRMIQQQHALTFFANCSAAFISFLRLADPTDCRGAGSTHHGHFRLFRACSERHGRGPAAPARGFSN